jgi:hypothetical protein
MTGREDLLGRQAQLMRRPATGDPTSKSILIIRSSVKPVISDNQKYFASVLTQISGIFRPSHREMRGVGHRH